MKGQIHSTQQFAVLTQFQHKHQLHKCQHIQLKSLLKYKVTKFIISNGYSMIYPFVYDSQSYVEEKQQVYYNKSALTADTKRPKAFVDLLSHFTFMSLPPRSDTALRKVNITLEPTSRAFNLTVMHLREQFCFLQLIHCVSSGKHEVLSAQTHHLEIYQDSKSWSLGSRGFS